jgi:methyltransferase (TIGR00027 family)
MNQGHPSQTAYYVALSRAAHQILDDPIVFEDPMAMKIVGSEGVSRIRSERRKFELRSSRYLRAFVVARSGFVEQELSIAVERGVRQYVILGAGLDTFAYRNPYSSFNLRIFELDLPTTQAWKRQRLDAAKIPIPECLTFVPIDFETEALADRLREAGFRTDEPALFSWLGVTMYLNRETMMNTMKSIASCALPGSEIVFDYVVLPSSLSFFWRLALSVVIHRMAKVGEPWRGFFEPDSLADDLRAIGFKHIEDIWPEQIDARFFDNRSDKLRIGSFGHLIKAVL